MWVFFFSFSVWHFTLLIKRTDIRQKSFIIAENNFCYYKQQNFCQNSSETATHFEIGKHSFYSTWVSDEYMQDSSTPKCFMWKLFLWNSAAMRLSSTFWIERIWHSFTEFTLGMWMVFLCDHYVLSNAFL